MKICVLADIHANLPALMAVLEDAADQNVSLESKAFWSLGDVVGYGPHPVEAVNFLKEYVDPKAWVIGNHDAMLVDMILPDDLKLIKDHASLLHIKANEGKGVEVLARGKFLNSEAWSQTNSAPVNGIELNRKTLSSQGETDRFWRKNFSLKHKGPIEFFIEGVHYVLVHASQDDPLLRYIYPWHAEILLPKEFSRLQEHSNDLPGVQWFGHTHVPTLVRARPRKKGQGFDLCPQKIWPQESYPLDTELALVNPGSVGQPRNLDQRACYAILDTNEHTVTFRRVPYDWRETAQDLQKGKYPESFVARLKTAPAAEKETPDEWLDYYQEAKKR